MQQRSLLLKATDHLDACGHVDKALDPIQRSDVIVIDEAGTVDSRLMHRLTQLVEQAGAKLVLVGDVKQNQPVSAGGAFAAIQKYSDVPMVSLYNAQRQKTALTRRVVGKVLNHKPLEALLALSSEGNFKAYEQAEVSLQQAVSAWSKHFDPDRFDSSVMITNTNVERYRLNELAREHLVKADLLDDTYRIALEIEDSQGQSLGVKSFTEGERIIFRKNDATLGVKNGELANIIAIQSQETGGYSLLTEKEDGTQVEFNPRQYKRFDHGYALTTYASQGMTVDHASVYIGQGVQNFNSTYVQFSRVRQGLDVSVNQERMKAYLSSIAPTERMLEAARQLLHDKASRNNLAQWSFQEVQALLTQHHVALHGDDFNRQFEQLGEVMKKLDIKKTSLDFKEKQAEQIPPGFQTPTQIEAQAIKDKKLRIQEAQTVWAQAKPLAGTVGEKYLKEILGITRQLNSDSIRFLSDAKGNTQDEKGHKDPGSRRPALIFCAKDKTGVITAVKQLVLDAKTGQTIQDSNGTPASLGHVKGAAIEIQQGTSNKVFIAEKIETAASVAAAHPDANVYATLDNTKNLSHLGYLAKRHGSKELVFLADNHGSRQMANYSVLKQSAQELTAQGITVRLTMPFLLDGKQKTEFNDVLKAKGEQEIRKQMQISHRLQSTQEKQLARGR